MRSRHRRGVEVQLYSFLNTAPDERGRSRQTPTFLPLGKSPGYCHTYLLYIIPFNRLDQTVRLVLNFMHFTTAGDFQATNRQNFKDIPLSYVFSTSCYFTGFA